MKRTILLLAISLMTLSAGAQTQQGVVKTKGRLNANGTVTSGQRLTGATIAVLNGNRVVSGANGKFALMLPSAKFVLESVTKKNYILADPDFLRKQYEYSTNDFIIVMEDELEKANERRKIEKQARSSLYAQTEKQREEINRLKQENQITEEKYRELLQKVNKEEDDNETIIKDMAEKYSKIDFDQEDDFNRHFSAFLLNGETKKADSLLRTKGNIMEDFNSFKAFQTANAQKRAEQAVQDSLENRSKQELADRFYKYFEIFKMKHQNDSAAYYLELRADLDSTNIEWLLDVGTFMKDYLANYKKAEEIYTKAEKRLSNKNSDYNHYSIIISIYLSSLYYTIGQYQKSVDYSYKALSLINKDTPDYLKYYSEIYNNIGSSYEYLNRWDDAQDFLKKSLQTCIEAYGEYHKETAICYSNLGFFYQEINQDTLALPCYMKALEIGLRDTIACYEEMDYFYNNLAVAYNKMRDYESADIYSQKALERRKMLYGENHPKLAVIYHNIGVRKMKQEKYDDALNYFAKATKIWENTYGEEHHLIDAYGTIGQVYELIGDVRQALAYYEKGAEVGIRYHGRDNSEAWVLLPSICMALEDIIKTNPTDSVMVRYQQFLSETAVIAIIPGGVDTPAVKLGMSGIYYILEYGQWNISDNSSFFNEFIRLQGKPRNVVFLKDGKIETHYFENTIGGNFMMRYVTPEEKKAITEVYNNMKRK